MTFLVPYAHSGLVHGLGIDFSQLLSNEASKLDPSKLAKDLASKVGVTSANVASLGDSLQNSALTEAARLATDSSAVRVNRERIAAAVHLGYSVLDTYQVMKPGLFVAGVAGTILSSVALTKRRKNPEAVTLYALTAAISVAVAWFARPDMLKSAAVVSVAPPESNQQSPGAVKSALAWTDARAAKLTAKQPGWEGATLTRLLGDMGSGTMAPAVRTLLTRNAH